MARYIEQQLEDQKKLLYLDIPTLRNHNSLMRKLHLNPRSELDLSDIGNGPLHKRIQQRFFSQMTRSKDDADERSGVEDLFVNKSTDAVDLNGSAQSQAHNISLITDGGYTNPLAFNIDDLDNSDTDTDDDEAYQRSLIIDNREFFIGAMPTPVSEGPASIAVWSMSIKKTIFCYLKTEQKKTLPVDFVCVKKIRTESENLQKKMMWNWCKLAYKDRSSQLKSLYLSDL